MKEIAELDEDTAIWNGDIKAATKVRELEKADILFTHSDGERLEATQAETSLPN